MPVSFRATSSVSTKADMRNRKSTGAMLSPCRTPTVWGSSTISFFNLENNNEVSVYACYSCNEAWRGAISFKDVEENVMVGCVVSFDKINECYMGWQIVIFS
jgi:hypothetical protein